jgi:hypothetical protein
MVPPPPDPGERRKSSTDMTRMTFFTDRRPALRGSDVMPVSRLA